MIQCWTEVSHIIGFTFKGCYFEFILHLKVCYLKFQTYSNFFQFFFFFFFFFELWESTYYWTLISFAKTIK